MYKKSTCSTTTRLEQLDYLDCTYTIKSTGLRMRTHQEELAKKKIRGMWHDSIIPPPLSIYNCWHCYKVILYQGQKSWKGLDYFHSITNISFIMALLYVYYIMAHRMVCMRRDVKILAWIFIECESMIIDHMSSISTLFKL